MVEIECEKRRFLQATYTPIKAPEEGLKLERTWEKWGFVAALEPSLSELAKLKRRYKARLKSPSVVDPSLIKDSLKGIETIVSSIPQQGTPNALRSVALFSDIEPATLSYIAEGLIELRESQVDSVVKAQKSILDAFGKAQLPEEPPKVVEKIPAGWKPVRGLVLAQIPEATVYRFEKMEKPEPRALTERPSEREGEEVAEVEALPGGRHTEAAMISLPKVEMKLEKPITIVSKMANLKTVMDWAIGKNIQSEMAAKTLDMTKYLPLSAEEMTIANFKQLVAGYIDHLHDLLDAFKRRMAIEPVGFLHLERMTFTPSGIERGKLQYSLPLAPGEEVNIAHKEWSNTSEEFEKIVTDYMEEYSEEGVSEKSELSQATSSQYQHSSGFNTGVTASGGYGPVKITASASYNVSDSASNSEQLSRNRSIGITRKSSSRTKKEHKMSFKVASASGVEEQTVRKIKNPFTDKATRVDFYQLIRKWKVDLYRYGIRLTYDINIPEPGSEILLRIKEINDIQASLEQGFGSSEATLSWARFDLKPYDITRKNYLNLAAQYNASVEAPPPEYKFIDKADTKTWTKDQSKYGQFFSMEIDVDKDYVVTSATRYYDLWKWKGEKWFLWVQPVTDFLGKSGKLVVIYDTKYLSAFYIELHVTAKLRDQAYKRWQYKVWDAIRKAAEARYLEQRKMLKDRLKRLTGEIGAEDALSLRKIEREEVMKGILRWLFGPGFEFVPSAIPASLYGPNASVISEQTWSKVLSHGEIIKFLHHAVEWENMLYFLYPYFWSHTSRWDFKKNLDHPDPMHRVFLKSGSARVVLTIRPGYEEDFVALLETGDFKHLPNNHPYMKITQEMKNYAKTNYPGIPPANPEEAEKNERGKHIGAWYEYTPTSALDIDFNKQMPTG